MFEAVGAVLCRLRVGEQERRMFSRATRFASGEGLPASSQGQQQDDPVAATAPCRIIHRIPPRLSLIFDRRSALFVEYETANRSTPLHSLMNRRVPPPVSSRRRSKSQLCNLGDPFSFSLMRSRREHARHVYPLYWGNVHVRDTERFSERGIILMAAPSSVSNGMKRRDAGGRQSNIIATGARR